MLFRQRSISAVIILLSILVGLSACGQKVPTWQEQYDLGVRYLSEGNYEEAIIAFTSAIEINPKNPEAYLRAAESYIAIGDYVSAQNILNKGYEETADEHLLDEMESLRADSDNWSQFLTDNMIKPEDFTIGGVPFYELSIEGAIPLLPKSDLNGENGHEEIQNMEIEKWYSAYRDYCEVIKLTQMNDSETLHTISYFNWLTDDRIVIDTEIRGISTCDTMEEVLEKIGVASNGAEMIASTGSNVMISLTPSGNWIDKTEESMGGPDDTDTKCIVLYLENISCYMYFESNRLIHFEARQN